MEKDEKRLAVETGASGPSRPSKHYSTPEAERAESREQKAKRVQDAHSKDQRTGDQNTQYVSTGHRAQGEAGTTESG